MAGVRDHTELVAWKLSDELRERVRPILARPALRRDDFALWDQINRAVSSPCPNLAEGFSRYYPRDFARFARIAKASLSELIDHMGECQAKGVTTANETTEIVVLAKRARKATNGLVRYLETAKAPHLRDDRRRRQRPAD